MPKKKTNVVEREADDDTLVDAEDSDDDTDVTAPDAIYCTESGDRLKNGKCPNRDCPLYNKPQG